MFPLYIALTVNSKNLFLGYSRHSRQESTVGPILFITFLNDFFYCIKQVFVHDFADDDTLSSFAETIATLMGILTSATNNPIRVTREVNINWVLWTDAFYNLVILIK